MTAIGAGPSLRSTEGRMGAPLEAGPAPFAGRLNRRRHMRARRNCKRPDAIQQRFRRWRQPPLSSSDGCRSRVPRDGAADRRATAHGGRPVDQRHRLICPSMPTSGCGRLVTASTGRPFAINDRWHTLYERFRQSRPSAASVRQRSTFAAIADRVGHGRNPGLATITGKSFDRTKVIESSTEPPGSGSSGPVIATPQSARLAPTA